ncbi:hypothetical protein ACS0TY_022028 [Phlomoides rotata]
MLTHAMRKRVVLFLVEELINRVFIIFIVLSYMLSITNVRRVRRRVVDAQPYGMLSQIPDQVGYMNRLFLLSDAYCVSNLRMDRNIFAILFFLMRELGGLVDHRYVSVEEQGCLGALDSTYIDLHVLSCDKPHFRTRKCRISTNVLGVCDRNMRFVYVLPGWEGSAADYRVLRDAILRPNGLKVPKGNYYLSDNRYVNSEGFLVPYRGFRYHLKEWRPSSQRPVNHQEHFNMRHTRARNVIHRAFGVLKMHFEILRSAAFYPVKTQVRLIMACFLLHNLSGR